MAIFLQKKIDTRLPPLVLGILSLTAACIVLLFPETKDTELPEDIEDLDPGPVLGLIPRYRKNKDQTVRQENGEKWYYCVFIFSLYIVYGYDVNSSP